MEFGIRLARLASNRIGTELSLRFSDDSYKNVSIGYRIECTIDLTPDGGASLDEALKVAAAQIGPAALYPYIRETLGTLSLKAGGRPVVLPVVSFRNTFELAKVELPQYSSDESAEEETEGEDP